VRRERRVPRLALTATEAAYALGVSDEFFNDHIKPDVRCVRRGSKRLYAVQELERFLEANGARALEADRTAA
jgi:hypothetical protein